MRKTNRFDLVSRDPAKASFMGALPADFGSDRPRQRGADFGGIDFGYEFGDDHPQSAAIMPSRQEALQGWHAHQQMKQKTDQRARLLEPNRGSAVRVERYGFSVSTDLTLGTASSINVNNNPNTNIRPSRVSCNVPCPGMVTLSNISVGNVNVLVGGDFDAYDFNPNGVDQELDLPTLTPANRATVTGSYGGLIPSGYVAAATFKFITSFKGWASMAP